MLRSRGTSVAQFIEEQNNKFLFTNQRLRAHLASDQPLCHELPSLSSRTVNKNRTLKISTRIYDKYLLNGQRPGKKKTLPQLQLSQKSLLQFLGPVSKQSSIKAFTTRTNSQADIKKFQFKTLFNEI